MAITLKKIKEALLYGFAGMVAALPFMLVFGSIYHFTGFFKAMQLDWVILMAYCSSCGSAMFAIWMTKKNIRTKLFYETRESVLAELDG